MEVSRISSKGQVTVPKSIRRILEVETGDHLLFIEENGKILITKACFQTYPNAKIEASDSSKDE